MARSLSILAGAGWQFFDNNGDPLSGGKIYTYAAGTTTPLATYALSSGGSANANPIVLDAAGRPSSGGSPIEVWLTSGTNYKLVITDSTGANVLTYDNVYGVPSGSSADISFTPAGTGAITTTVQDKLREYVSIEDYDTLRNALAQNKRVQIPPSTTSITVSTTDSPYVLPKLYLIDTQGDLTINLDPGPHDLPADNNAVIGDNGDISVVGAAPIETTLTSVYTVSGTKGNYTITYNVASVTNMVDTGYLKLDNIIPQFTLNGDNSFFHSRIAANELGFAVGPLDAITTSTGGTTGTFASFDTSKYSLSTWLSAGDLITVAGQTRSISAVGPGGGLNANQISVGAAWRLGVTGTRGWWVCIPNTGTLTGTGAFSTTVSGYSSSTKFIAEANVGDFILVDGQMAVITGPTTDGRTITSDTSLTVSPGITVPSSTSVKYSIITAGFAHEGTHEIVSIDSLNNRVTVTNKWNGPYPPPKNAIGGGSLGLDMNKVSCIRTVLQNNNSGDGFLFRDGGSLGFLNDLVLVQNIPASSVDRKIGINLAGRRDEGPTQLNNISTCVTGDNFAALGWYIGAFAGNGCTLESRRSHYMNSTSSDTTPIGFNIYALEGATVNALSLIHI